MLMLMVAAAAAEQQRVGEFPSRRITLGRRLACHIHICIIASGNLFALYVAVVIDIFHKVIKMIHEKCLRSAI